MSHRRFLAAAPLDDDNLLEEILLRLPPQPSSLPRASLVCKRWSSILSDHQFLGRFRKHHRRPPLIGFFVGPFGTNQVFTPVLNSPDRIPSTRFTLPKHSYFMGCWRGYPVLINRWTSKVIVWDPLTGQQRLVPFPPWIYNNKWCAFWFWHAVVICTDAEDGHVHADCFSSPFKLVLIWVQQNKAFGCLYESASGVWGDSFSMTSTDASYYTRPSVLVGNAIYWLLCNGDILSFDFERPSFAVIKKPTNTRITHCHYVQLLRTRDGELGLAVLSELTIKLWQRKSNCYGVVGWVVLPKTIQLEDLFPRIMHSDRKTVLIVGYDEETNAIVLSTMIGYFMLQLDSLQISHINKTDNIGYNTFHPYRSFYTAECHLKKRKLSD